MFSLELSSVAVLQVVKVSKGVVGGALYWRHGRRQWGDRPLGHKLQCVDIWWLYRRGMSGHVPWRRWCHIHSLGRSCGVQLYLRHRAPRKVSLWTANPWATMSNAVSQLWAPFSLPSSSTLCRCWQSGQLLIVFWVFLLWGFAWWIAVSPRSPFCCSICVVSGSVTCSEEVCSSTMVVGFTNPRPPWQDGSARKSCSISDGLSLTVRAGRNCWRMVSLRGCISGDIPSTVFRKYVQWPVRQWVSARKRHGAQTWWWVRGVQAQFCMLQPSALCTLRQIPMCQELHQGVSCLYTWCGCLSQRRYSQP